MPNDDSPTPAVESVAVAPVQEEHDDLMALVQSQPAEEPAATVAEATSEAKQVQTVVTAESARTARIAANTAKQQQRINARLARCKWPTKHTNCSTCSRHTVWKMVTSCLISPNVTTGVADLIIANNHQRQQYQKRPNPPCYSFSGKGPQQPGSKRFHTVRKGDTLNTIASRFNVDINDIRRWNRNTVPYLPGQRLKLIGS